VHLARTEEGRSAFKMLIGKPTGKESLGRLFVNGRTVLEWILEEYFKTGNSILISDYWRPLVNGILSLAWDSYNP
jgi:hypothetical protein